jgi:hypothetical protein
MDAITLIVVIALIALLLWLVPMPEILKKLCYVIAIVVTIFWVLSMIGVAPHVGRVGG